MLMATPSLIEPNASIIYEIIFDLFLEFLFFSWFFYLFEFSFEAILIVEHTKVVVAVVVVYLFWNKLQRKYQSSSSLYEILAQDCGFHMNLKLNKTTNI